MSTKILSRLPGGRANCLYNPAGPHYTLRKLKHSNLHAGQVTSLRVHATLEREK
jgi:putative component of membrane protein insertase Oxa1/YidC/SpoIIIJ protein YidD